MRKLTAILVIVLGFHASVAVAFAAAGSDRITVAVRGNGPDIVLIPGLTCSAAVWDATARHLESRYRVHLVQVAGFAGTPTGANANGPVLQPTEEAIFDYIRAQKLRSPRVIGHSMGGLLGLRLAIDHPESIGSLMIVDALPFAGGIFGAKSVADIEPSAAAMRDAIIAQTQDAYAQSETQMIRSLVKSEQGRKLVTTWALASDKSVVARAFYESLTTDLRPKLADIKIPVTILYPWDKAIGLPQAAVDKFYAENYAALPHKRLVRIDNALHFIMLDQPEAFLDEVDKFAKPLIPGTNAEK